MLNYLEKSFKTHHNGGCVSIIGTPTESFGKRTKRRNTGPRNRNLRQLQTLKRIPGEKRTPSEFLREIAHLRPRTTLFEPFLFRIRR